MNAESLVGRRRELDALRVWLDAACRGSGRLVVCAGEAGVGKTRLAQELAGHALARGVAVTWGRCAEIDGAPPFWPWRQALRTLGAPFPARGADSPEDRFRLFDEIAEAVLGRARPNGLLLILDDVHWADEPSLLVLRHLANQLAEAHVLVLATHRDVGPLADLPAAERIDLQGFSLAEVREQLADPTDAATVLDLTGGNPLFVHEVTRAMADGTWRPDRPPRRVVDVVASRLDRVSRPCRRFVQAAAVVGRDFSLAVVAAALGAPAAECLPHLDEAIAAGLVDRGRDGGDHRFVHALTREAVDASLSVADRAALHRAVALALETEFGANPSEHLSEIAGHWLALAPYGEAATARQWALRAADEAVHRLAYEEAVRLYRLALELPGDQRHVQIALGRACYLAGDPAGCLQAATSAAHIADTPELLAEAALVLEAAPEPLVNAVARQLSEKALEALGPDGDGALRARLLAQRSHLAYYDGDQAHTEAWSAEALALARQAGDDRALEAALRARKEACPGPAGREERLRLAGEMVELAPRTGRARSAMWGELWRIEALVEGGDLTGAADRLAHLQLAVDQVGGPVSQWHLHRATAQVAQAQGRLADAAAAARRGFERMRPIEPRPALGSFTALQCALARHAGITPDAASLVEAAFEPLPRFRTMGPILRSSLLIRAGRRDEAAASYDLAGPLAAWSAPAFYSLALYAFAVVAAGELGRHEDVRALLERLAPFRGEHASAESGFYAGPVALALGRGHASLGHLDAAIADLAAAAEQADRAGARAFAAEARYHWAETLAARAEPGDRARALVLARTADSAARALGMAAYTGRTAALVAALDEGATLSPRELAVARLVSEGLTNRQIAERLVISERTAQNHVQHVLTKLGFTSRSQVAAWMSTKMSNPADGRREAIP